MAVITISRQYGGGGDEIAAQVRKRLNYRYFDKRMMAQIAAEIGLSPDEVIDFSEDNYKVRNFMERLLSWRGSRVVGQVSTWTEDTTGTRIKELQSLDEVKSVALVQGTIQEAYKYGNVVIVGRAGQAVLGKKPDVLHVRIEAPLDIRNRLVAEQQNISLGAAQEIVLQHDRAAAEYLKRFYDIDWDNSMLYDLVINTAKLNKEAAAQLIVSAVSFLPVVTATD